MCCVCVCVVQWVRTPMGWEERPWKEREASQRLQRGPWGAWLCVEGSSWEGKKAQRGVTPEDLAFSKATAFFPIPHPFQASPWELLTSGRLVCGMGDAQDASAGLCQVPILFPFGMTFLSKIVLFSSRRKELWGCKRSWGRNTEALRPSSRGDRRNSNLEENGF